ncbi:MAG: HAMP domain-containing histidine kinase [Nodularia sp. (in: cyanobacteria)]|nr:HAMP domain-containing histidine kinase [Nodularia sp. (in: cyanobacteria)]
MAWDIGSTLIFNGRFSKLRNRLLLSYLLVIATILGTFSTAVYILVVRDRNQQLNAHLRQIAAASASTLEIIQHEYEELSTQEEYKGYVPLKADGMPVPITLSQLMGKYRADSVSQLVANPLTNHQGVEWFDGRRRFMVYEGGLFPSTLLPNIISSQGSLVQYGKIRSFILPVYSVSSTTVSASISTSTIPSRLGYVRVSESTLLLEAELRRFQTGLVLGVLIVSGLVTLGGFLLTRESLKPVVQSFDQLREFTSDASHELRNPLTAIRASVAVMQSHPERIHPADVEKLGAIATASAQMSHLVDDLLLLARMDWQAPDQSAWRRIALDEMLEDLVDLYSDRATQAHIFLQSQLIPNIEVYGDASQLQRLFTNLLGNALKYSLSGGTVNVSLQRIGTSALVSIEDTGIGISPDQLSHIFERFWRADQVRSQHENSSGLGLAIAKTITQRHGGEITVRSQLGVGSCFYVKIPLP